ncbi:hypothetical protein BDA99DRAFT_514946 [Phascolomyces articulosus]|uniref:Uncharacterized protein n=1 Tax=Phascolomyces articulosus TaxID=60185 RepID=A0AAD5JWG4_9FUNG|nr:hypothetical protein BDA99DRAFT_514946 [Phascolomyces articulosus]
MIMKESRTYNLCFFLFTPLVRSFNGAMKPYFCFIKTYFPYTRLPEYPCKETLFFCFLILPCIKGSFIYFYTNKEE